MSKTTKTSFDDPVFIFEGAEFVYELEQLKRIKRRIQYGMKLKEIAKLEDITQQDMALVYLYLRINKV